MMRHSAVEQDGRLVTRFYAVTTWAVLPAEQTGTDPNNIGTYWNIRYR